MKQPILEEILYDYGRSLLFRRGAINSQYDRGVHYHNDIELVVIEHGRGTHIFNEVEEPMEPVEVMLIPPGVTHRWKLEEGCSDDTHQVEVGCCHFKPEVIERLAQLLPELGGMANFYLNIHQAVAISGNTADTVRRVFAEMNSIDGAQQVIQMGSLLSTIYLSTELRIVGFPMLQVNEPQSRLRFREIWMLIGQHYHRHITLSEAAATAQMSPTAFCNAFKTLTGCSFNAYLTSFRMQKAVKFLFTTSMQISEIAYRVGYNDVPHFNRTFKRHFGISPTDYRKHKNT